MSAFHRNGDAETKKKDKSERRLISYADLPAWCHDNEFIMHGYRAPGGTIEGLKARQKDDPSLVSNGTNGDGMKGVRRRKGEREQVDKIDSTDEEFNAIQEHNSFARCWESVWLYAHNETVNIHTHLWGALVAILAVGVHIAGAYGAIPAWLHPITHHAIFYPRALDPIPPAMTHSSSFMNVFKRRSHDSVAQAASPIVINALLSLPGHESLLPQSARMRINHISDWLGFASYLFGAVTVLSCSATFHTVACHSATVAKTYNKLDYIGIVAMIVGSFLPILHYGFYCHVRLQLSYSALILTLGAAASYTVLSRKFTSPAYRPIRTSVFIALGSSAVFPVAHILSMYGFDVVSRTMGLHFLVAGGALYIIGACLYMARVPERFAPGTFDYLGASHQLFHILILFAAFCHYVTVRRSYAFWHSVEAISRVAGAEKYSASTHAICAAFETFRSSRAN